ncbi:MAG TPA: class I SAM-dependent methyltransferase [Vicinamibacterales bacterium]|nr:class I SAM-dependent methyltransferase [Vicinamibacterales bacterium]
MPDESLSGAVQRFYDAVARKRPDQPFLNYGFDESEHAAEAPDLPRACRRLYETILQSFPSDARSVVEIGCGRGGGAEFLLSGRPALAYAGFDLSHEHVSLCRRRFASRRHTNFAQANAAALPAIGGRLDAAFSIEAAQHFDRPDLFYQEVARLLRPGGTFLLASLWQPALEPTALLESAGLRIVDRRDITANVVASLARTSGLREALVDSLEMAERFRPHLLSWAGVRGTPSFDCLASRALIYLSYRLVRK